MKHIRRFFAIVLVALFAMATLSGAALASKNAESYPALQTGKWYTLKSEQQVYTLRLAKDSLVTATWEGNRDSRMGVYIYLDSGLEETVSYFRLSEKTAGNDTLVLAKGTYYVSLYDGSSHAKVKFAVAKLVDKKNYCPSRAVNVSKNTKTILGAHSPMDNFSYDWFKVTLPKGQKLTICCDEGFEAYVYDSKLRGIETESYGSLTHKSIKKLPAGTYYIRIGNLWGFSPYDAHTSTFWWK